MVRRIGHLDTTIAVLEIRYPHLPTVDGSIPSRLESNNHHRNDDVDQRRYGKGGTTIVASDMVHVARFTCTVDVTNPDGFARILDETECRMAKYSNQLVVFDCRLCHVLSRSYATFTLVLSEYYTTHRMVVSYIRYLLYTASYECTVLVQ